MSSKNDDNGNDGLQVSSVPDVESMKIPELKQELKQRGLKTTGRKNDLIERLRAAMLLDSAKDDGTVYDDDDGSDDGATPSTSEDGETDGENTPPPAGVLRNMSAVSAPPSRASASAMLTFKDVEESMRTFSGDDELSVQKWIEEFEEMSKLCDWSEVQRIVYSKRLLRGSAKLFVNFENCCKSWKQLKTALSFEFAPRVNSRQVHLELSQRKKKPTETYQEYVYKMMEIASQVNMDIQSALLYIVDGIPDTEANKAVLYGASSLKELRAKLTIYENMTSNAAARSKNSVAGTTKKEQPSSNDKRCFNCGDKGHRSRQCKDRHKGPKCFNCNDYGHVSSGCPKKGGERSVNLRSQSCRVKYQESTMRTSVSPIIKNLRINGVNIEALIDTGSDLNLIKSTQYLNIGAPTLLKSTLTLSGIGQGRVTTVGKCEPDIELDGIVFKSPVYIVPDDAMANDVVIGRPVLHEVTLVVNSDMLRAIKLPPTVSEKKMDIDEEAHEKAFLQSLSMAVAEDDIAMNKGILKKGANDDDDDEEDDDDEDDDEDDDDDYDEDDDDDDDDDDEGPKQAVSQKKMNVPNKAKPNPAAAAAGLSAPQKKSMPAKVEEFDCVIEHRAGANMRHVDALSRNPLPVTMLVQECRDGLIARLQRAQQEDEELRPILEHPDDHRANGYVMKHGILYKEVNDEPLLVIPKSLQFDIIKAAHEQGHFATGKTEAILKRDYWCKEMRSAIERVIKSCVSCILAERKSGKQEGLLRPIDKGDLPLDTYHVDHLGPLPSTKKKYRYIFAVVDAFTKHVWLYPTRSTTGEEAVNRLKKQSIIFGNPRRIISDRGTAFTSHCFEDYCKEQGIEYIRTTTGVPRGNGQIERVNRTLIPVLTKLTAPKPEEWHKHVDSVQQWLNATPCRSTRYSPFEILIGKRMKLKECNEIRELIERETIEILRENRDVIRQQAHANIKRIQEENRRSFNKKRKESTKYREGDLVAIQRTQFGAGLKLYPKFLGPYKIASVLRNDRYIVEKIGDHEGPQRTSASVDHLKPWIVGEMLDEPRNMQSTSEGRCSSRMAEL